jgi:glutamate racemase
LKTSYARKRIGLIATKATINSNVYKKRLDELNIGIILKSKEAPSLAAAIENRFHQKTTIDGILEKYLSCSSLTDIEALILGCTHYPIIKKNIESFYGDKMDIIDPSEIIALAAKTCLERHDLLNKNNRKSMKHFYTSGNGRSFLENIKFFFDEEIIFDCHSICD